MVKTSKLFIMYTYFVYVVSGGEGSSDRHAKLSCFVYSESKVAHIKYADSFMQRFAGPLANYNESVIGFISVVVQHK